VTGNCVGGDDHFGCHKRYSIQDILDSCQLPQNALLHRVKVRKFLCSYGPEIPHDGQHNLAHVHPPLIERACIYIFIYLLSFQALPAGASGNSNT
jgi:hypothetical protein